MVNKLDQRGTGIIGVQDVTNSTVNITLILANSAQYKDWTNQLNLLGKLFDRTPQEDTQERLQISQNIAQLESQIEQFKQDVLRLAQEFSRIEINTDRLRRAKEHFEKGEIAAARAVFDGEREQMQDENNRLVKEKVRYEQDTLPMLKHSSDEFYLRALLERTAYDNPNWLDDTCEYFERSINAFETEDNVFGYALFLQNHNRFDQAETWYQKFLSEFAGGDQSKRGMTLNNLANLHSDNNELVEAAAEYAEALDIYRNLAAVNPSAYLSYVAGTLNNLAILHRANNELVEAAAEYAEALDIRRNLAAVNPSAYLPDVAATLNNLAVLHSANNEMVKAADEYAEALEIRRNLAAVNPSAYLPDVAMTLNNLAILHRANNELAEAAAEYAEALNIYRKLAAVNPSAYLPYVATTLNNLAILHSDNNELVEAAAEYAEALNIYRDLAAVNPSAYLPDVAMTLNNLAVLQSDNNEMVKAAAEYAKALEIRRKLAAVNPSAYLPDVATTLISLAIYHLYSQPNREVSVNYAIEVMTILSPIVKSVPHTQLNFGKAIAVLQQGWGLSSEEIERMLAEAGE